MMARYRVDIRRACELSQFPRAAWYCASRAKDLTMLRNRIREIAASRTGFGYKQIRVMRRREGWKVNHKRVHRFYRLDGLQLWM
jgi:putative transposase